MLKHFNDSASAVCGTGRNRLSDDFKLLWLSVINNVYQYQMVVAVVVS